ncbi:hypothetical protein [Sulfurimonas sp.]|uniref:hypothetical protein n=1 Tax=Sulfurimonas sp. TaxID=2022749 RepID=UPI0025DD1A47|nr:hypothetical protein [Sulfurimonas sp.]MBW6489448.1 hypothetical protein [Sulfurimonas sp.]
MNCNGFRDNFIVVDKVNCFVQINNGNLESSRKIIRDGVVDLFKNEPAGQGTGDLSTKAIYCVEKINQEIVYLKRPATLNNGFDFEIHIKALQFNGRIKSRPRHQDIFELLNVLKINDFNLFNQVQIVIDEIYNCDEKNINIFEPLADSHKQPII